MEILLAGALESREGEGMNGTNGKHFAANQKDAGLDGIAPLGGSDQDDAWVAWGHADTKTRTKSRRSSRSHPSHVGHRKHHHHHRKTKRRVIIVICVILALIVAYGVYLGVSAYGLMQDGRTMESEAKTLHTSLSNGDDSEFKAAAENIKSTSEHMKATVDNPLWSAAGFLPVIGTDFSNIHALGDMAQDLASNALMPIADGLSDASASGPLVKNGTVNVPLIAELSSAVGTATPALQRCATTVDALPNGKIDKVNSMVGTLKTQIGGMNALCQTLNELSPYLSDMLGAEDTRTYLVLAHNTAEQRSSGGFIGSVGTVKVTNGKLELGEFGSFWGARRKASNWATVTAEENKAFSKKYGITPGDCGYNPDFVREGEMAKEMWDSWKDDDIDGVIGVDSHVLASVLSVAGDVTTSDGAMVTGDNVVQLLGHDLYWKYFANVSDSTMRENNHEADAYFAEVARLAFNKIFANLNGSSIAAYADALGQDVSEHRLMVWMSDPDEEKAIKQMGVSGEISTDAANPVLGIYLDNFNRGGSKMDWWLKQKTTIGTAKTNADGSKTYKVTTTFTNTITDSEVSQASTYILGKDKTGQVTDHIYLYAPYGGNITNISNESDDNVRDFSVKGIKLYKTDIRVAPGHSVNITYEVTTSAEATGGLQLRTSPMAQK